jgi:hypothetical protein
VAPEGGIPATSGCGPFEAPSGPTMAVAKFSRREMAWAGARQEIASRCHKRFTSRLCRAAWLQRALFKPPALGPDVPDRASNWFWRGIFERTR